MESLLTRKQLVSVLAVAGIVVTCSLIKPENEHATKPAIAKAKKELKKVN